MSEDRSNPFGAAGLTLSILGILTCGILSPAGLIISLVGVFQPNSNTSVAGAVLGAVGTLPWLGIGLMMALGLATDFVPTGTPTPPAVESVDPKEIKGEKYAAPSGRRMVLPD